MKNKLQKGLTLSLFIAMIILFVVYQGNITGPAQSLLGDPNGNELHIEPIKWNRELVDSIKDEYHKYQIKLSIAASSKSLVIKPDDERGALLDSLMKAIPDSLRKEPE